MRRRGGQLSLALVALILGVLVVVQLRTQASGTGLESLSTQELTVLVGNLSTRNDQLRTEVANLQAEAATLETASSRGETSVGQLQSDLARVRAWSGIDPLEGSGVRITVAGPIDGAAVEDLLNELGNAGAEGIAVGGVRVVAGTVVSGPAGGLSIGTAPQGQTSLGLPFEIDAVGDPQILVGTLTRAGGIVAQLAATFPDAPVTVTPVDRMLLAATTRSLVPVHGKPRG